MITAGTVIGNLVVPMQRTETYEEIKPLIDLCKAGKLFEVQKWIASGKPVNGPPSISGYRRKGPLEVAIGLGFHSLVEALLEGGAAINEPRYNPLQHALWDKRLDLIGLLVKHGADYRSTIQKALRIEALFCSLGIDRRYRQKSACIADGPCLKRIDL